MTDLRDEPSSTNLCRSMKGASSTPGEGL